MLFSHSLTAFSRPDLLGFGLILMKKQDPFAFISCESRIHSQSDLGLCKDVCFPILFFFFFSFMGLLFFALVSLLLLVVHLWQIYCRVKDLSF